MIARFNFQLKFGERVHDLRDKTISETPKKAHCCTKIDIFNNLSDKTISETKKSALLHKN